MTGDYTSFYLSMPHIPPLTLLSLFFLGLMRMAPIVAVAPFLGARLPGAVKIGFTITLTIIMLPKIMLTYTPHLLEFSVDFILYSLKELVVGMFFALVATIPFYFAESAGIYIDFLRGSSALQVTDPTTQAQASSLGLLYNYVFIVLFFQINGHIIFLDGILNSYTVIPVDKFIPAAFFSLAQPFWKMMMTLLTTFTAISIQLAAPSLVAILMAEMFLGIANRLAPQVQIAFLGMSLKSLIGLVLLWAGWMFILQQMGKQALLWLQNIDRWIQMIPH